MIDGKYRIAKMIGEGGMGAVYLGQTHAAAIIHRDLEPDDIFILREKAGVADYVKIIDFGMSKFNRRSTERHLLGST